MLPDRVSNPGPLTYESGALPIALRGPAGYTAYIAYTIKYVASRPNHIHDDYRYYSYPTTQNIWVHYLHWKLE